MVQFKAGSYRFESSYIRSIERVLGVGGRGEQKIIIVNTNVNYSKPEEAALHAKMDIDRAKSRALEGRGTTTIDHELVALGYLKLD